MFGLNDLEGRWQLSRTIMDARAGLTGQFKGKATWMPDGHGLVQEEHGVLRYGDATPMQATRRYLWRADGDVLKVLFEDGRPFHDVPIHGQEALHDCPPDTYRVCYTFDGSNQFSTRWHVKGPRKDAVLTTHFTRL